MMFQVIGQLEEELGNDDEGLDESKVKDILAARTNARLKEVQTEVFRVMLDWHRALVMMVSRVSDEYLLFPEFQHVLEVQAVRQTRSSVLQAVQVIEERARRLDRNIPDVQIFDEAFRKLIR